MSNIVRKQIFKILKEEYELNGQIEEGWMHNLATGLALAAGAGGGLKAQNQTQNTDITKPSIEQTQSVKSDSKTQNSAMLGFIVQHGDNIVKDSGAQNMEMMGAKKEVMKFCEAQRDGKPTQKLSTTALSFYNTVSNMLKKSANYNDYVQMGLDVSHG
jgi:hypothetical protein